MISCRHYLEVWEFPGHRLRLHTPTNKLVILPYTAGSHLLIRRKGSHRFWGGPLVVSEKVDETAQLIKKYQFEFDQTLLDQNTHRTLEEFQKACFNAGISGYQTHKIDYRQYIAVNQFLYGVGYEHQYADEAANKLTAGKEIFPMEFEVLLYNLHPMRFGREWERLLGFVATGLSHKISIDNIEITNDLSDEVKQLLHELKPRVVNEPPIKHELQPGKGPNAFEDACMCFASMKHISPHDGKLLSGVVASGEFEDIVVYPHTYGYFIYLDDDLTYNSEGYLDSLTESGYSKEFIQLMIDAKARGYNYLKMDSNQAELPGRHVFDWSQEAFHPW